MLVVACALAAGVVTGSAQSKPALSTLTVPAAELPAGCALRQPSPLERTQLWYPGNPWFGTDRRPAAAVRGAIDGAPSLRIPDAPPLEAREITALQLKMADNVIEAYHADYVASDGSQIGVWAATFNDATLAKPDAETATMKPPPAFRSRIVKGATVVLVSASARSECAVAVEKHARSLK